MQITTNELIAHLARARKTPGNNVYLGKNKDGEDVFENKRNYIMRIGMELYKRQCAKMPAEERVKRAKTRAEQERILGH